MKRLLIVFITLCFAIGAAACTTQTTRKKRKTQTFATSEIAASSTNERSEEPVPSDTDADVTATALTSVSSTTTTTQAASTTRTTTRTTTTRTTVRTTTTARTTTTRQTATTVTVTQSEFKAEVLRLVNVERNKAGLAPLSVGSAAAQSAADVRTNEIKVSFSHTRPNGSSCFTALSEAGVHYHAAGENIAYGYRTPAAVMEGWMNSAGHRSNILNPSFTHVSISFDDYSWTQLFYTP